MKNWDWKCASGLVNQVLPRKLSRSTKLWTVTSNETKRTIKIMNNMKTWKRKNYVNLTTTPNWNMKIWKLRQLTLSFKYSENNELQHACTSIAKTKKSTASCVESTSFSCTSNAPATAVDRFMPILDALSFGGNNWLIQQRHYKNQTDKHRLMQLQN